MLRKKPNFGLVVTMDLLSLPKIRIHHKVHKSHVIKF
jgi:hypothetical protein